MKRRLTTAASTLAALVALTLGLGLGVTPAQAADPALPKDLPLVYGDKGDAVRKAQYRLTWLGFEIREKEMDNDFYGRSTKAVVKQFQRKFFLPINGKLNKDTWRMLDKVGDNVGKLPKVCLKEKKTLCIDKTSKLLRYVRNGKIVQTLDVRFGVPGLDTPTGTYRVWYKDRYATSGINGPNVPRVPMPYALFFNHDIAVHYSSTFAASGYYPGGGSHGCVNVADLKGVAWLFDEFPAGGLVHVYWG